MVEVATVLTIVIAGLMGAMAFLVIVTSAFLYPKVTAGLLVLLTMLSQTIQTISGVAAAGYGDEFGVLLAFVLFVGRRLYTHGSLRWYPALWFFLGFALLGVLSSVLNGVPPGVMATGAFLFLKGPLLGFAIAQLAWTKEDIPKIARFGVVVILFVLATTLVNAAAPSAWNTLIGRVATVSERGGFSSLIGPFDHPVGLGTTMSLAFLAVLLYRQMVRRTTFNLALMIATGLACIAAFRRKSIAAAALTAIAMRAVLPGRKGLYLIGLLTLLPAVLIMGWGPLTTVVQSTYQEYTANVVETARVRMTLDAVTLSLGAFPLGVGFGRFGSFAASENYSPIYEDLGYQWIYGMGPGERGGFLSDTFWPAPFAEAGILGGLCYAGALFLLVVPAWRLMRRSEWARVRWVGAVTTAWFVSLTIESVVAPVFVSPPMFALPFVAAGICTALSAHLRDTLPRDTLPRDTSLRDTSRGAGATASALPWEESSNSSPESTATPGDTRPPWKDVSADSDDHQPGREPHVSGGRT